MSLRSQEDSRVRPFVGDIYVYDFDEDEDDEEFDSVCAGQLSGAVVPLYRGNEALNMLMEADEESCELCHLVESVWNSEVDELKEELEIDPSGHNGLLCFETIVIEPKYRGINLGAVALAETIEALSPGMLAAVLQAHPINPGIRDDEGAEKLAQYWESIGFVRNKIRNPYMFMDLTRVHPLPKLKEPVRP